MKKFIEQIIYKMENYKITFWGWVLAFFSIAYVRDFFEGLFENTHTIGTNAEYAVSAVQMFLLFNLEWTLLFCGLILILYAATGEKLARLFKITLVFYAIIIIVPFLDFAVYFPAGGQIDYLTTLSGYVKALKYFFVFNVDVKVTAGIRVEVLLAVIFSFIYVFIKKGSVLRGLFASALVYLIAVSSMGFPVFSLLHALPLTGGGFDAYVKQFFFGTAEGPGFMGRISLMILFMLVVFSGVIFFLADRKKYELFINSMFNRAAAVLYPAFYLIGFAAALIYKERVGFFLENPFNLFLLLSGFVFMVVVSGVIFLIREEGGAGGVKASQKFFYKPVFFITVFISFCYAAALSYPTLLSLIFIYSLSVMLFKKPFKLVLTPFLSEFMAATFYFSLFLAGYTEIEGVNTPVKLPLKLIVLVFAFALCGTFILKRKKGSFF